VLCHVVVVVVCVVPCMRNTNNWLWPDVGVITSKHLITVVPKNELVAPLWLTCIIIVTDPRETKIRSARNDSPTRGHGDHVLTI
jgi:hypothetical protein